MFECPKSSPTALGLIYVKLEFNNEKWRVKRRIIPGVDLMSRFSSLMIKRGTILAALAVVTPGFSFFQ